MCEKRRTWSNVPARNWTDALLLRVLCDADQHEVIAAGREVVEIREFLTLRVRSFRPDVAGAGSDRDLVGTARHEETIRVHHEVGVDAFQPADRRDLLRVETLRRQEPLEVFL